MNEVIFLILMVRNISNRFTAAYDILNTYSVTGMLGEISEKVLFFGSCSVSGKDAVETRAIRTESRAIEMSLISMTVETKIINSFCDKEEILIS